MNIQYLCFVWNFSWGYTLTHKCCEENTRELFPDRWPELITPHFFPMLFEATVNWFSEWRLSSTKQVQIATFGDSILQSPYTKVVSYSVEITEFLLLRFYVKSILVILQPKIPPFWPFEHLWILNFWEIHIQKCQKYPKVEDL